LALIHSSDCNIPNY